MLKCPVVVLFALALASGCSNGAQSSAASASPSPTVSATPTESATATAAAATTSPAPTAAAQFNDIAGNFAENAIDQEAALGVFGPTSGAFHPDDTVTRGQYVAWLVTANNLYFKDTAAAQIRLAGPNADQMFVDLPKTNPNFAQIEGMADAGYVIGIDKTHFAPDRPLTREELLAIQVSRYSNGATMDPIKSAQGMYCVHLADAAAVSKPYWPAFNYDQCTGFNGQDDLHRIFGSVKMLHPQRPATRAEVAVALQRVGGRNAPTPAPH